MKWVHLAAVASIAYSSKVVEAPIQITRPKGLMRRDGTFDTMIANEVFYYAAEVGIGTPPQPVKVVLDTGSSDLWVMRSSNPYCQASNHLCRFKTFDPAKSSTWHEDTDAFAIKYGDLSYALGNWGSDAVEFAGACLKDAQFAVANDTNSTQIVLGIGLPALESTIEKVLPNGTVGKGVYDNLPQLFKKQGYIGHVMYSLWLNGGNSEFGSVLFGGIDHSKYEGELTLVPIINLSQRLATPYSFHIMLNGIRFETPGKNQTIAELQYPALLDSGTSFAYLPPEVVKGLAASIGYEFDPSYGYYVGACETATDSAFVFNFSGADIRVPVSSLVMPYSTDNAAVCALTVLSSHNEYSTILGDVFLRNIYAVFDLENYEIGFAQAKINVTASNISENRGSIPGVRAPLYNITTPIDHISVQDGLLKVVGDKESQLRKNSAATLACSPLLALACLVWLA